MLNTIPEFKSTFKTLQTLFICFSLIFISSHVSADVRIDTAEYYRDLGYEEQQKGNLNEALNFYFKASSLGLESSKLYNDIAIIYEKIGIDHKAERNYLKAIQLDSSYLPAYINIAYFYQRHGKLKKAANYFRQRYELGEPDDPWSERAKVELLRIRPDYQKWINYLEAEKLTKEIEEVAHREFMQRIEVSKLHYKQGQEYFSKGEYRQAVREYNKAISLMPKNSEFIKAREDAMLEMAKENVREYSTEVIRMLDAGDPYQARTEIKKMLSTIPTTR